MHAILAAMVGGTSIPSDVACALAARLAAGASGVAASEVVSSKRASRRVSTARQIGIYLAHTAAGLPLTKVAEYFGRDRTTAAYACRLIEDRRDDRKFDAEIEELENLLRAICGGAQ
jgi:chromosomal replication initiation ATPase DnaA